MSKWNYCPKSIFDDMAWCKIAVILQPHVYGPQQHFADDALTNAMRMSGLMLAYLPMKLRLDFWRQSLSTWCFDNLNMVAKAGPLTLAFFVLKMKFSFQFQLTGSYKIYNFRNLANIGWNTIDFKLHKRVVFFTSFVCHFSVAEAHTLVVFVDSFCTITHLQRSLCSSDQAGSTSPSWREATLHLSLLL